MAASSSTFSRFIELRDTLNCIYTKKETVSKLLTLSELDGNTAKVTDLANKGWKQFMSRIRSKLAFCFCLALFTSSSIVFAGSPEPSADLALATNESRFRQPVNPYLIDRVILESPSRPFDAALWACDVSKRQSMLINLLRLIVHKTNRAEIISLIGGPVRSFPIGELYEDEFDLGEFAGEKLILRMTSGNDMAPLFQIGQYSGEGYLNLKFGDWRWKNPQLRDAASDMNKLYRFVGAPRKHLCQFIGHPPNKNRTFKVAYLEIELTADMSKVRRFRFIPDSYHKTILTAWEDKNLRAVPGSFTKPFDFIYAGESLDAHLVHPGFRFTAQSWSSNKFGRENMLFDLIHSYPLIGKSRKEIRELLGEPIFSEASPAMDKRRLYLSRRVFQNPPYNRFDWFALTGTGCCEPAEPSKQLEIVYSRDTSGIDIAAGYRTLVSDKYQDGVKRIFGRILSKDIGCLSVAPTLQRTESSRK